ncbi:MAG: ABC transporter permease [Nitrospinota bacterium]
MSANLNRFNLQVGLPMAATGISLVLVGWIVSLVGASPFVALRALLDGAFGSPYAVGIVLVRATPLILTGLSVGLAFRCGLFNIGAEGQLQVGAAAAVAVGIFGGGPPIVHAGSSLLAGFLAGGLYGAIPGYIRARFGASEIITTLMMNYIAIYGVIYLVLGPMGMEDAVFPQTARILESSELPRWIPGTQLHAGFWMALLLVAAVWVILKKTTLGYEFRVIGENPSVARQIGIPTSGRITLSLALCGGLSGLAGAVEILGVQFRLAQDWSYEWGYTAIAVAFLGGANAFGILAAALYFGVLQAGADSIQAATGVPAAIIYLIESLPVLIVLALSAPRILTHLRNLTGRSP